MLGLPASGSAAWAAGSRRRCARTTETATRARVPRGLEGLDCDRPICAGPLPDPSYRRRQIRASGHHIGLTASQFIAGDRVVTDEALPPPSSLRVAPRSRRPPSLRQRPFPVVHDLRRRTSPAAFKTGGACRDPGASCATTEADQGTAWTGTANARQASPFLALIRMPGRWAITIRTRGYLSSGRESRRCGVRIRRRTWVGRSRQLRVLLQAGDQLGRSPDRHPIVIP